MSIIVPATQSVIASVINPVVSSNDTGNPILDYDNPARIATWTMGDIVSSTLNDSSPNSYNMNITGATQVAGPSNGDALRFVEANPDYCIGTDISEIGGAVSFSAYGLAKISSTSSVGSDTLIGKWRTTDNNRSFIINVTTAGIVQFIVSSDGVSSERAITVGAYDDDTYHLVVGMFDHVTGDITLDIDDGAETVVFESVFTSVYNSADSIMIGAFDTTNLSSPMQGDIGETGLMNRILTREEITAIKEALLP